MTMRKYSSDNTVSFAFGMFRRGWAQMLLYFLVFFFTMTVPTLVNLSDISDVVLVTRRIESVYSTAETVGFLSVLIVSGVAVFAGCASMRYLSNKVTANFYHSIPMKREKLYATCYLSCLAEYVIAYLAVVLITLLTLAVSEYAAYGIPDVIWHYFWIGLLYGFVFYSITVFAGTLTGSSPIQFLLTLVIVGILPAIYVSLYSFASITLESYVWVDYYFNMGTLTYLTPLVRIFTLEQAALSWYEILLTLLLGVVFVVGGMLFHRIRKTEKSACPVAFDWVGSVVKYVCAFPITILGGVFFYYVGGNGKGWIIFGFVCGAVLWTMLVNTIVTKSAKTMFRGVKGLAVFAVLFSLFAIFCGFDCFDIMAYTPKADTCDCVEISIGDTIYELNGAELDAISETLDKGDRVNTYDYNFSTYTVRYALHKGSFTYAVNREFNKDDYSAILKSIRSSDKFSEQVFPRIESVRRTECEVLALHNGAIYQELSLYDMLDAEEFYDAYFTDLEGDTDLFNTMTIGYVSIYRKDVYTSYHYPVYSTFSNTIAYLQSVADTKYDACHIVTADDMDLLAEAISYIEVVSTDRDYVSYGETVEKYDDTMDVEYFPLMVSIYDKEQIKEILNGICKFGYYYLGYITYFTETDNNYYVNIYYPESEIAYGSMGFSTEFFEGAVPSFVEQAFADAKSTIKLPY